MLGSTHATALLKGHFSLKVVMLLDFGWVYCWLLQHQSLIVGKSYIVLAALLTCLKACCAEQLSIISSIMEGAQQQTLVVPAEPLSRHHATGWALLGKIL